MQSFVFLVALWLFLPRYRGLILSGERQVISLFTLYNFTTLAVPLHSLE